MDMKKLLIASLAGGATFMILGYVIYDLALGGFFEANAGSATGVEREAPIWWSMGLGQFLWAMFLGYIYLKWARISTFGGGASAGFVLGLLSAAAFDFTIYGMTNIATLNGVVVDIIAASILVAIGGGVIGAVIGMGDSGGGGTAEAM